LYTCILYTAHLWWSCRSRHPTGVNVQSIHSTGHGRLVHYSLDKCGVRDRDRWFRGLGSTYDSIRYAYRRSL